jgi:iron complex transport system ATP-binding protein
VQELSGGERQRVALAMSLAQAPQVLLLDEPTTHLDPAHAQGLLDVVARKHRDEGLTVVAVFHDLNLAALAAARVVVIDGGEVVADGPPAVALAPTVLARTFGPVMHAVTHPVAGVAQVLPARAPLAL